MLVRRIFVSNNCIISVYVSTSLSNQDVKGPTLNIEKAFGPGGELPYKDNGGALCTFQGLKNG